MPLGIRLGDTSDSRLCGVETVFHYGMSKLINLSLNAGKFDFIVAPLMHPGFRPSLTEKLIDQSPLAELLPASGSDYTVSPTDWNEHVVGKISSWIDLDSDDENLRADSENALKQEIAWASYLSLQACLLPTPKGTSWVNYARCVNQILQGLKSMRLWLRIPLGKSDDDSSASSSTLVDPWEIWNSFRLLCEHHSKLWIAFDILSTLPSDTSLKRWFGEPVSAAIIRIDVFLTKAEGDDIGKYLPERHQKLITSFFDHSVQIIISGQQGHPKAAFNPLAADSQRHPLRHYLEHLSYLYKQLGPLPEKERMEFGLRDVSQSHLQPLKNNLNSQKYENLEKDSAKYAQWELIGKMRPYLVEKYLEKEAWYQRAICQALLDRVPDEKASEITTVLMVVGAGRGTLVLKSIQAAKDAGRKLKIYAVEKNPNAIVALKELIKSANFTDLVTIISSDMRHWNAPETADILVSELLCSFGDNELSPECIDGAQRFLKEDGISIPSSYTSFLQPVTASKLYNDVKKHRDVSLFEAAYFAKMHNVARLAPSQPVFTFTHPKHLDNGSNDRYKKLRFVIPKNTGSAMVHGFAGYFDAILYKDVHIGIEASTATSDLLSWFAMFFPLRTPIRVDRGSTVEVHFWRCTDSAKVWYEWCVTSPSISPIYNSNGRSYWVEL